MQSTIEPPEELTGLIFAGSWPSNAEEATAFTYRLPLSAIRSIDPLAESISLEIPPFRTIQQCIESGVSFYEQSIAAPQEISFHKSLVIGDFGINTDTPIILDYQQTNDDTKCPIVKTLRWGDDHPVAAVLNSDNTTSNNNHWVVIAPDFATFARKIGLVRLQKIP